MSQALGSGADAAKLKTIREKKERGETLTTAELFVWHKAAAMERLGPQSSAPTRGDGAAGGRGGRGDLSRGGPSRGGSSRGGLSRGGSSRGGPSSDGSLRGRGQGAGGGTTHPQPEPGETWSAVRKRLKRAQETQGDYFEGLPDAPSTQRSLAAAGHPPGVSVNPAFSSGSATGYSPAPQQPQPWLGAGPSLPSPADVASEVDQFLACNVPVSSLYPAWEPRLYLDTAVKVRAQEMPPLNTVEFCEWLKAEEERYESALELWRGERYAFARSEAKVLQTFLRKAQEPGGIPAADMQEYKRRASHFPRLSHQLEQALETDGAAARAAFRLRIAAMATEKNCPVAGDEGKDMCARLRIADSTLSESSLDAHRPSGEWWKAWTHDLRWKVDIFNKMYFSSSEALYNEMRRSAYQKHPEIIAKYEAASKA